MASLSDSSNSGVNVGGGFTSLKEGSGISRTKSTLEIPWRKEIFLQDPFDAPKYARERFMLSTLSQVEEHRNMLVKEREGTAEELKSNVYSNYPKFISTSQEIANLEADMVEFGTLLTGLNTELQGMREFAVHFGEGAHSSQGEMHLSSSLRNSKMLSRSTIMNRDIQWLMNLPVQLEVCISQKKFEEAVKMIEAVNKMFKENPKMESAVKNTLKPEIEKLLKNLVETLLADIQNPIVKSSQSRLIISYLQRLGMPDKAREVYLESRSKRTEREAIKLKSEGDDLSVFISHLAHLVFASINTTCEDFRSSFNDHNMISGFVVWATAELEKFGNTFGETVFDSVSFETIGKCLQIVRLHCTLLEEKGLSLSFVLTRMFYAKLVECVEKYYHNMQEDLDKELARENWKSSKHTITYGEDYSTFQILQLTSSAKFLYNASQVFVDNITCIFTFELLPTITQTVTNLFETYLLKLSQQFSLELADTQSLSILGNSHSVVMDLVPRLLGQLKGRIGKPVKDFEQLSESLNLLHGKLKDLYCTRRAELIMDKVLEWDRLDYSQDSVDSEAMPSNNFISMFNMLSNLKSLIKSLMSDDQIKPLLSTILEEVTLQLRDLKLWEVPQTIKQGGLQQVMLDMHFLIQASTEYLTDVAKDAVIAIMHTVKSGAKKDAVAALKSEEWCIKQVKAAKFQKL